jgi:hypothetical protein
MDVTILPPPRGFSWSRAVTRFGDDAVRLYLETMCGWSLLLRGQYHSEPNPKAKMRASLATCTGCTAMRSVDEEA